MPKWLTVNIFDRMYRIYSNVMVSILALEQIQSYQSTTVTTETNMGGEK